MTKPIAEFSGDYRWLSNFEPVEVDYDGVTYSSVEHAYQAAKFREPAIREKIRAARTPGAAKRQARLWPITTPEWHVARLDVMAGLLRQKFKRPDLAAQLVATGDAEIIEGNRWGDVYWGVCNGEGDNHLGILLMEQRERLGGAGVVSAVDEFDLDDFGDLAVDHLADDDFDPELGL